MGKRSRTMLLLRLGQIRFDNLSLFVIIVIEIDTFRAYAGGRNTSVSVYPVVREICGEGLIIRFIKYSRRIFIRFIFKRFKRWPRVIPRPNSFAFCQLLQCSGVCFGLWEN